MFRSLYTLLYLSPGVIQKYVSSKPKNYFSHFARKLIVISNPLSVGFSVEKNDNDISPEGLKFSATSRRKKIKVVSHINSRG